MANTPLRAVRIPTKLWEAVRNKADTEEKTITAVIIGALEAYLIR